MLLVGEKVVQHQREKNLQEEKMIKEFQEKKNRAMDLKEKRLAKLEKENKESYKKFLEF